MVDMIVTLIITSKKNLFDAIKDLEDFIAKNTASIPKELGQVKIESIHCGSMWISKTQESE